MRYFSLIPHNSKYFYLICLSFLEIENTFKEFGKFNQEETIEYWNFLNKRGVLQDKITQEKIIQHVQRKSNVEEITTDVLKKQLKD